MLAYVTVGPEAILGTLDPDAGRLSMREIARFPNETVERDGHLHWDIARLFAAVRAALAACAGSPPDSVGVDTWGVDFGLLDSSDSLLCPPFAYRDKRTDGAMESFFRKMPPEELYRLTGEERVILDPTWNSNGRILIRQDNPLPCTILAAIPEVDIGA